MYKCTARTNFYMKHRKGKRNKKEGEPSILNLLYISNNIM